MSTLIEDVSKDTFQFSFEQTVPRSLVHKRSLENVLLTEIRTWADDRFLCAGRIPTAHRFFNDPYRAPRKDILFYTELGRQASLAVSHAFLGVSADQVFIFEQSQAALKTAAWQSAPKTTADSVVTEIRVLKTEKRRNDIVSRVVAEQTMSVGSDIVFHGVGAWTIQPPALFQRLRRLSAARASVSSENVVCETGAYLPRPARRTGDNVVITAPTYDANNNEFSSFLIVDDTHPYFFDHPCDHVPGMLLLEGCAQLAVAAVSRTTSTAPEELTVSAYDVNFAQFVEPGHPIVLTAHLKPAGGNTDATLPAVEISIAQQNVVSGATTMSVVSSINRL
jgi:3-hydroxymyristoyl/3-hydroxydecanoyl-(acyl carrier protein) dehydratase